MNKRIYCEDCAYCHWDGGHSFDLDNFGENYSCIAPENYISASVPFISPNPIPSCCQVGTPQSLNAKNDCKWFKEAKQ